MERETFEEELNMESMTSSPSLFHNQQVMLSSSIYYLQQHQNAMQVMAKMAMSNELERSRL